MILVSLEIRANCCDLATIPAVPFGDKPINDGTRRIKAMRILEDVFTNETGGVEIYFFTTDGTSFSQARLKT